jgi:hypothetical protein
MKNKSTFIAALLAVVLSFTLIDPFHISSGKYDSNPYTEIAAELNKSSTTGVLVLASYNDYYKFPVFNYLRDILGTRLAYHGEMAVEYQYDEVLAQASLGEESFLQYLQSKNISHLIIPMATVDTASVFHRWSTHGTISLDLNSSAFSLVKKSGGNLPLALYKVRFDEPAETIETPPSYSIAWEGVRPEFYQLRRIIDEGYNVHYLRQYEERIDTAWVFQGEQANLTLNSSAVPEQNFTVEMQFVAAYGDSAPPQILKISHDTNVQVLNLKAGEVGIVTFSMRDGQTINIESMLGCRQGISFDPEGQDIRKFCYGLRNLTVRITK